jgi:hypothetical protein
MTKVTRFLASVFCLLPFAFLSVVAQQRDAPSAVPVAGTASIHGVLTSEEVSPHPIRRAIVTISGAIANGRSVLTDDEGRFAFERLPAGRYSVTASKAAYLATAYGAIRPGRSGTPIVLAADSKIDITMRMTRGAVVAGVIHDARGNPLPGVQVGALDLHVANIDDLFQSTEFVTTDDRGAYRIFGLMPGEYAIAATARISGSGPIGTRSTAEMDTLLAYLRQRPGSAASPSGSGGTTAPSLAPPAPPSLGYAPTYYPGASQFRDATRLTIAPAEERTGLDFAVVPIGTSTIEGTIQGTVPNLASVELTLITSGPRLPFGLGTSPVLSDKPDAQGHFKYTNVTPGQYTIMARGSVGQAADAPASMQVGTGGGRGSAMTAPAAMNGRAGGPPPSGDWVYGLADADVAGHDITGVSLSLVPGSTFAGRVVFDRATEPVPPDVTKISVRVSPPNGTSVSISDGTSIGNRFASAPVVNVKGDGTFVVPGIAPGSYQVSALPPEITKVWALRSAISNGRDLLDYGIDIRPGADFSNVTLTFSDRHTEVAGTLTTATGDPAPEYFVIAMPADRSLWRAGARRVKATRPASDGAFSIKDLPGGDYLLVALTDVAPNEWNDVDFLKRIAVSGVPVTLGDGEKKTQDLRIAR